MRIEELIEWVANRIRTPKMSDSKYTDPNKQIADALRLLKEYVKEDKDSEHHLLINNNGYLSEQFDALFPPTEQGE